MKITMDKLGDRITFRRGDVFWTVTVDELLGDKRPIQALLKEHLDATDEDLDALLQSCIRVMASRPVSEKSTEPGKALISEDKNTIDAFVEQCEQAALECGDLPDACGARETWQETLEGMAATAREKGFVTAKMEDALNSIIGGMSRWERRVW